jgi:hypothetical protein
MRPRVNWFYKALRNVSCLTQLIFVPPVGIDPMLEHDGHESIWRPGLSSDIQRAIGQRLRQHHTIERSLPARLADLLKEFERRSNEPDTVARGHYVNAAAPGRAGCGRARQSRGSSSPYDALEFPVLPFIEPRQQHDLRNCPHAPHAAQDRCRGRGPTARRLRWMVVV